MNIRIEIAYRTNSDTSAVNVVKKTIMIQDLRRKHAIKTVREAVTYKHVASAAAAAGVVAAVHISGFGVDLSETERAGLVLPQTHLAARHPASFRPS